MEKEKLREKIVTAKKSCEKGIFREKISIQFFSCYACERGAEGRRIMLRWHALRFALSVIAS
jgi:hypothetical protein